MAEVKQHVVTESIAKLYCPPCAREDDVLKKVQIFNLMRGDSAKTINLGNPQSQTRL